MAESRREPVFPVGFDDDALAEDLDRLPVSAEIALREFRKELRRHGGIPRSRLMACQAEGRDGTRLGGCVKTYIPWPDGRFGAVFVSAKHPSRPIGLAGLRLRRQAPPTGVKRRNRLRGGAPPA